MIRRWLLGVVLVAGACTPFAESPATSPGEDDGTGDASVDGPSSSTPGDAGDPGDGGRGDASSCGGKHVICEDFDGDWSGWQRVTHPSSPLNGDSTRFVSPPRSLSVEVDANAKENHPSFLSQPVPAAERFTLSADVRVALLATPDGEVDVLALELTPTGFNRYYVAIIAKSDGRFHLELKIEGKRGALNDLVELGPIAPAFTRLSIDLDLAAGRVLGAVGAVQHSRTVLQAPITSGTLAVGATWAANTKGKYAINVDNVILD